MLEDEERGSSGMLYDFLETCLRHKSEVRGNKVDLRTGVGCAVVRCVLFVCLFLCCCVCVYVDGGV